MSSRITPQLFELRRRVMESAGCLRAAEFYTHLSNDELQCIDFSARDYFVRNWPNSSAVNRLSGGQKIGVLLILAVTLAGSVLFGAGLGWVCFLAFAIFSFAAVVMKLILFGQWVFSQDKSNQPNVGQLDLDEAPIVTVLVPVYQENHLLMKLETALGNLDYPRNKLDIKILVEEDDPETDKLAREVFRGPEYHVLQIPFSSPKTKPKACNYGLFLAQGEYCVIYDAEDEPEPDQIMKAVQAFEITDQEVVCLQARLNYYNRRENILTRLFSIEYSLIFDVFLPGLCDLKAPIPLGGTSNFFRTEALIQLGGWDAYNVTEDADLGLRLYREGFRCEMLESTTWEEAVPDVSGWIKQRSRWIKGYCQTWLVHGRKGPVGPFSRKYLCWQICLQFIVAGVIVAAIFNPIFWVVYALWIAGLVVMQESVFEVPFPELITLMFLLNGIGLIYINIAAASIRGWYAQCVFGFLMPAYWLLLGIAGYVAIWELLTKPFYWAKTKHFTTVPATISSPLNRN